MAKNPTFEESMDRLDEIVELLEGNEQSLDETISLFEEGLKLVKSCDSQLKKFEAKVAALKQESMEDEDHEERDA
jgi:exodeoxyribonuclease VII small subunit